MCLYMSVKIIENISMVYSLSVVLKSLFKKYFCMWSNAVQLIVPTTIDERHCVHQTVDGSCDVCGDEQRCLLALTYATVKQYSEL